MNVSQHSSSTRWRRFKDTLRMVLAIPFLIVAGLAGLMLPAKNYPMWEIDPDFYMKLKMGELAAFLVCGLLAWALWPDEANCP